MVSTQGTRLLSGMGVRFVVAVAAAFCAAVLAWAAWPPTVALRIEPAGISPRDRHAFAWLIAAPAYLPDALIAGDDLTDPQGSRLQLYEQGRPLGPAHAMHDEIAQSGAGRFSHWNATLIFSTSDNTDPRRNGRAYEARARIAPPAALVGTAGALAVMLGALLLVRARHRLGAGLCAALGALASAVANALTGARAGIARLAPAAPATLLAVSTLLLLGVIGWSLFPPHASWRIEPGEISLRAGHSFAWTLPRPALHPLATVRGDDAASSTASQLELYEDGRLLGPPHDAHALISDIGAGLYSHWGDTIVFATPDNSDPRSNGRNYTARAPVIPPPWLMALTAAMFAAALMLAWRQRLRGAQDARWAGIAASLPAALVLAAALTATLSLLGLLRAERTVSAAALSPDGPQAVLGQSERVSRNGVYALDFSRFHAPFLEVDCCTQLDVRRGATPVPRDTEFNPRLHDPRDIVKALRLRADNRFFDLEDYLYFRLDTPPRWDEAITLVFPVKARPELVVVLWLAAIVLFGLRRRLARFIVRPSPAAALTSVAAASAALGVLLLAINATGLFVPLRYAEIDHPSPDTLRRSYGPGDRTITWDAARAQLAPAPAEPRAAYAHRLTNVVAQSVLHYWYQRDRRQFHLQVPVWENYLLWLAGELHPAYQLYVFADPLKAIERGIGMCDQVSATLTALLRQRHVDARVVQLNGHTVVTAEVDPGVWHVLDADFNVVIPRSIAQIQADPEIVRTSYKAAFARIDPGSEKFSPELFVSFYAPPTYIGEADGNSALGESRARVEATAYWLKWRLPIGLLAFAGVIFAGVRMARRRRTTLRVRPAA